MANSIGEMVVAITGNTDDFNLSIDQAGKKFDSLTTIIANSTNDMIKSFKDIDNEAKLWGNSTDLIKQKFIFFELLSNCQIASISLRLRTASASPQ